MAGLLRGNEVVERTGFRLPDEDVLGVPPAERGLPLPAARVLPPVRVEVDAPLVGALELQRRAGSHLGEVTGPDGRTVGMIALQDVVGEFVGEVADAGNEIVPA